MLAGEGLNVSPYQLERWRRHGLLPRANVVRSPRGGSHVNPHDLVDLHAAAVLAETSKRGTAWQQAGLALFHEGLPMTQRCLRECADWATNAMRRRVGMLWEQAMADLSPAALSDEEVLADIAAHAEELSRHHRPTGTSLAKCDGTCGASSSTQTEPLLKRHPGRPSACDSPTWQARARSQQS